MGIIAKIALWLGGLVMGANTRARSDARAAVNPAAERRRKILVRTAIAVFIVWFLFWGGEHVILRGLTHALGG